MRTPRYGLSTRIRATEIVRYDNPATGAVSYADLDIRGARFPLTEETGNWNSDAPPSLGGSPVVLLLRVDDVHAALDTATAAGAAMVFPLTDFAGERMTRIRDPFGHLWSLTQLIEELTTKEIRERRAALFGIATK